MLKTEGKGTFKSGLHLGTDIHVPQVGGQSINERFYSRELDYTERSAIITESDNSYVAYLVKRFCEDHGYEGEDTSIMLGNFSGALG